MPEKKSAFHRNGRRRRKRRRRKRSGHANFFYSRCRQESRRDLPILFRCVSIIRCVPQSVRSSVCPLVGNQLFFISEFHSKHYTIYPNATTTTTTTTFTITITITSSSSTSSSSSSTTRNITGRIVVLTGPCFSLRFNVF